MSVFYPYFAYGNYTKPAGRKQDEIKKRLCYNYSIFGGCNMILYLIRHGETDWNKEGKLQGRTDVPLNDEGKQVAEWTRQALADVPFDIVYTSPLQRARMTAEILVGDRKIPIVDDERIIEVGFGLNEGISKSAWDANMRNFFLKTEDYIPAQGGETLEEVLERERKFLQELFENPELEQATILISTHGAALSGLLTIIKQNPIAKFWAGGLHKNCGLSIIEVKKGIPNILNEAIVLYEV